MVNMLRIFHNGTERARGKQEDGAILVTILGIMIFLTIMLMGLAVLANSNVSRARGRVLLLQAQYAAESGADAAIAYLNDDSSASYTGTGAAEIEVLKTDKYEATYKTSVASDSDPNERIITATGYVYAPSKAAASAPEYTRKIRVTAKRTSTEFTTGILSHNILYANSGVKNINAKDVYVNGFIYLNKNTTNLIAQNITVVGKNTGATNCSIGGSGDLIKPSSFNNPTQTKTNITVGFNNCINPPGNTGSSDFNVQANQKNIPPIQSTYIPWSQYMDSSYTNAGNCNDWTSGSFPRNIPSVSGSKATHYPDNGSNVSLSCGLLGDAGDLGLGDGQYNINDNVHLRASLCFLVACNITFNNPNATLRWVFIEGSVNFASVKTVPGSGPIVLVVYGADPITKILSCPYGGSVYIGNDNSGTNAPALYIIASNGICFDKTKFTGTPALGGISGKNIYINANPSTNRDLTLDPLFPVTQIPVNLTWRQTGYERLNN